MVFQLCMSAMSQHAGSGVILETCSAEKATQRWKVEGKFVLLDVFNADEVNDNRMKLILITVTKYNSFSRFSILTLAVQVMIW